MTHNTGTLYTDISALIGAMYSFYYVYIMGMVMGQSVMIHLEGGRGVSGEEGLLLILHHLSNDLLLLEAHPGFLPRAHLPQQNPKSIHICRLQAELPT